MCDTILNQRGQTHLCVEYGTRNKCINSSFGVCKMYTSLGAQCLLVLKVVVSQLFMERCDHIVRVKLCERKYCRTERRALHKA